MAEQGAPSEKEAAWTKTGEQTRKQDGRGGAPLGQAEAKEDTKAKIKIRYEMDKDQLSKKKKKDVHEGSMINPLLSRPGQDEVNFADPQVQKMVSELDQINSKPGSEAEALLQRFEKQKVRVTAEHDLIESYQIEAFMVALQKEENYMVLEKLCVQFRVQDASEFNLERLAQQYHDNANVSKLLTEHDRIYELFGAEQYLIARMNPYQLAVIFNNLKALRYMTLKLHNHLRLCLEAPELTHGGLQVKESDQVKKECWPLFVAINNNNIKMLMFLWQDLGNTYNISVGSGYGNVNSNTNLELGQDKLLMKKGYAESNNLRQMPLNPSNQKDSIMDNGNRCQLWVKAHLFRLLQALTEQRYLDGLKFILTCQATHDIYMSMSIQEKLYFLHYFLVRLEDSMDVEMKEIFKLKLTEKPYASLSVFLLIQLDRESLSDMTTEKQEQFAGGTRASTMRLTAMVGTRQSQAYGKILQNAQSGEDHLDKRFRFLNGNIVHLEYAIENMEPDEVLKFKYESTFFNTYVQRNLEILLRLSQLRNPIFFEIAKKLSDKVNKILRNQDQEEGKLQFFKDLRRNLSLLLQDSALKKNWADYRELIDKNLFYWAKIGDLEKFSQAVERFQISTFNRIRVAHRADVGRETENYHKGMVAQFDAASSDDSFDLIRIGGAQKKKDKRALRPLGRLGQDAELGDGERFKNHYVLPELCPTFDFFKNEHTYALLTPLQIAIQYKHFDIVRFILQKMKIDVRMSLALATSDNERRAQEEKERNNPIQEPLWFHQLSEEQVSFGLLIACANKDEMMLQYLWEHVGRYYWVLGQFRCVMKQLIFQEWFLGINMIFQNEVTQQMVKCLSSVERSRFIQDYIGHLFSKNFGVGVRRCLIYNLCQQPYAGSLLILLVENFEQLLSLSRRNVQDEERNVVVALGRTKEEAEAQFQEIWKLCLKGLYPMEIKVLKETCHERFTDFAESLDRLDESTKTNVLQRNQAIKVIQLLKGCSTYKGIFEELEPLAEEEVELLDGEDREDLQKEYDRHQLSERFYKQISRQTYNFERATKAMPGLPEFLRYLVYGNVAQVADMVKRFQLEPEDLLQLRGLNFEIPIQFLDHERKKMIRVKLDAHNWNPIVFAACFRQVGVLQYFNDAFGRRFDLVWALGASSLDQQGYDGVRFSHIKDRIIHMQEMERLGAPERDGSKRQGNRVPQDQFASDPRLKKVFLECSHLRGHVLAILTKNMGLIQFLQTYNQSGNSIRLNDIKKLLVVCKLIGWIEGEIMILLSQITKNQFILSTLQEKHDLIKVALEHAQGYYGLQKENMADDDLHTEAMDPSITRLRSLLYQYPYVSVTWLLLTDLTADRPDEDDKNEDETEYEDDTNIPNCSRFVPLSSFELAQIRQTLRHNFTRTSIAMLDSVGQAEECMKLCMRKQEEVQAKNHELAQKIDEELAEIERPTGMDPKEQEALLKEQRQRQIELKIKEDKDEQVRAIQKEIMTKLTDDGVKQSKDLEDDCRCLVEEMLYPPRDRTGNTSAVQLEYEHKESSMKCLQEFLTQEKIIYLQSIRGFSPDSAVLEPASYSQELCEALSELYRQSTPDGHIVEAIPVHRLNCLHWIILAKRDDMYKYVIRNFFKSGAKGGAGAPQQQLSLDQVSISIEPHVLGNCLRGGTSTEAEFLAVHLTDKKQGEILAEERPARHFTAQFKGWEDSSDGVELSQQLQSKRKLNHRLQISNLGLLAIILARNSAVLSHLNKEYPTILMSCQEDYEEDRCCYKNDILDGALLCAILQWSDGLTLLLDQAALQFSNASMLERLAFVQKVLAIRKQYRHKQTQNCCAMILEIQKVRVFASWLAKQENHLLQEQLFRSYCLRLFSDEQVATITAEDNALARDPAVQEFQSLLRLEKEHFQYGVHKNLFQDVLRREAAQERVGGLVGRTKDRDMRLLTYMMKGGAMRWHPTAGEDPQDGDPQDGDGSDFRDLQ